MKLKLLIVTLMLTVIGMLHVRGENYTGVLVTTPDGATTYALSETPQIKYTTTGATTMAQLFIKSQTDPVVQVAIANGAILKAQWGTFTPTGINDVAVDKATSYEKNGRKYITGGKLVIISTDGTKYDINGNMIK